MADWQIAIETSGQRGSVALLERDVPVEQVWLAADRRTATTLAPAVERLVTWVRAAGDGVRLVSVTHGPGSFTGLRIGVTAAKTLAFALDCPVIGCDTLAVVLSGCRQAINSPPPNAVLDAAINAYRGQVFWRQETLGGDLIVESRTIDRTAWLDRLRSNPNRHPPLFASGDAWDKLAPADDLQRDDWQQHGITLLEPDLWQPTASELGRVAWRQFETTITRATDQAEIRRHVLALKPNYLRESAAVEKRNQENR